MQTATLFVADDRDRELLAEWLGEVYDVSTPTEPRVSVGTDLVLVDDASFPEIKSTLQEWKDAQNPVFAPVVLVTEQTQDESFDPSDWQTIDGLYVIDDIVSAPIKKAVLYRRLENLLERRDLSEQLARRYRRSEQRFEMLFDGIPDPVFVLTPDGVLSNTNETFRAWFELPREDSIGIGDIEALPAETVSVIEETATAVLGGADPPPEPPMVRIDPGDGDEQFATVSVAPVTVGEGAAAIVVLRDVTERQCRERSLQETEARFRQIAEHVSEVIWLADADGELLYVSPGYEELTGRSPANLTADSTGLVIEDSHPVDADRVRAHVEGVFDDIARCETEDSYTIEYRLRHDDGSVRWVESDTYPVYGHDGVVTRLVGILDDVTERKRRERRFNAIFNQTFQLTALLQPDGTVLEVNDRATEYLGFDRESVIDERLADISGDMFSPAPHSRLLGQIEEAADGEFVRYEETLASTEGAATLDISIKPIRDGLGNVVLLVIEARDVTDRKRRERDLARQNDRLEEFASIVSHDLRNPLQIIRARIDIARDTGDLEHLLDAEDAVDRMARLIDDLLDLARHGDLSVDPEAVDVAEIADRAWLGVGAEDAHLRVETDGTIRADPDRLTQLLENLFRNAVEHSGPGVTVRIGRTDDGPGIPQANREEVFQLGHTTDTNGTGFGLAIVVEIAEAHGWSIAVTESEAGGARFEISGVE